MHAGFEKGGCLTFEGAFPGLGLGILPSNTPLYLSFLRSLFCDSKNKPSSRSKRKIQGSCNIIFDLVRVP